MRARMVLRKKGMKITERAIQDERAHPSVSALTLQDVHAAMEKGDEVRRCTYSSIDTFGLALISF